MRAQHASIRVVMLIWSELPGSASAWPAVTLARLTMSPAAAGAVTASVAVTTPPLASAAKAQTTAPPASAQLPPGNSALTNATPGGSVSVRITPVAARGPRFRTASV